MAFFAGFSEARRDGADGVRVRVRAGGEGPPVVLLHGHPRTHTTWHRVAPLLTAAGHTVVCPDLRGYGQSSTPPTTDDHGPYSKRAMARDVVTLMRGLGHERFAVVGHDRGSYVALRTALDNPGAVTHLAVLDCIPIVEHLDRADARFATAWWHWFFFAQPDKPERAIGADPDAWYGGDPAVMGEDNHADFPAGDPRPGDRARDARGLPSRPRRRPGRRGGRPGRRTAGRLPDAGALIGARRPRAVARRPAADLGRLDERPARRRAHRQRPPRGGGGSGGVGRGAGPLPGGAAAR